jgi:hypothetical protein
MSQKDCRRAILLIKKWVDEVEKCQEFVAGESSWDRWEGWSRELDELCRKTNIGKQSPNIRHWPIRKTNKGWAYVISKVDFPLWKKRMLELRDRFVATEGEPG